MDFPKSRFARLASLTGKTEQSHERKYTSGRTDLTRDQAGHLVLRSTPADRPQSAGQCRTELVERMGLQLMAQGEDRLQDRRAVRQEGAAGRPESAMT